MQTMNEESPKFPFVMKMVQHHSINCKYEVQVNLYSNTPVVNCQVNSSTSVRSASLLPPSITFTWYREQIYCSVHCSSLATYQCVECVALKLQVKDSYHCSTQCFVNEWKKHKERHRDAADTISKTSNGNYQVPTPLGCDDSWHDLGNGSLHDESATKVEKEVWAIVGSSKTYLPTISDLGRKLRLEYVAIDCLTGIHLSPVNVIVTEPVIQSPPPPPPRCMMEIKCLQKQSMNDATFTVLSYNILSDLYACFNYHCPRWALTWEYRRQNLLREIIGYHADIICLQEVQSDHFESFFKPELTKYGYSVIYKKKTKEVYTANRYTIDGCATFYRHNVFKEIMKYEVEFGRTAMSVAEALEPEQRRQGQIRLMKDNVALVVILEAVKNGRHPFQSRICVANTHIHADRKFPDVKLCQVVHLVKGLEKISESKIPLLICGDLNSVPKSDPYKFIVTGKLDTMPEKKTDPLGIYRHLKLQHSLPLVSAYLVFFQSDSERNEQRRNINPDTHEPVFTNHKRRFSGTLDYIFFTEDSLKVETVLELLDKDSIGGDYLPSPLWSSDHIALMARFSYKPPSCCGLCPPVPQNPWLEEALGI